MSEIKNALTAEEWAQSGIDRRLAWGAMIRKDGRLEPGHGILEPDERHGLAALALCGQPFGFTREMLVALRKVFYGLDVDDGSFEANTEVLRQVADRIEALLPPPAHSQYPAEGTIGGIPFSAFAPEKP